MQKKGKACHHIALAAIFSDNWLKGEGYNLPPPLDNNAPKFERQTGAELNMKAGERLSHLLL